MKKTDLSREKNKVFAKVFANEKSHFSLREFVNIGPLRVLASPLSGVSCGVSRLFGKLMARLDSMF
jgi:hypothetical protein